jgi:subtilisin family serine protease
MRFANFTAAAALSAICGSAHAQIRLPALTLPATPLSPVSQSLDAAGPRALDAASEWRHRQIGRLVRGNKRLIETDPNGEPVVRSEIIAVGMSEEALARARAGGFLVERETAAADIRLIVLEVPEKSTTRNALRALRAADPQGLYDYNHIYLGVGVTAGASPDAASAEGSTHGETNSVGARVRVGLLDTGIDPSHPAFRDSLIHSWGCKTRQIPAAHGTAVASLLVAHGGNELFAADVYCGSPTGGSVDAIVAALGWLSEQAVQVINVSLVGPKNVLLERVVSALIARGHLIVAAVGNDGPAAPPLYPAAYPDVVGVTAVDANRRVLIEAERGPQVMFAAQGADLKAATLEHGYADVRGTSFAAPTVAALLASFSSAPDHHAADAAIDALAKSAIHLGSAGRNLTYGFGLVGER